MGSRRTPETRAGSLPRGHASELQRCCEQVVTAERTRRMRAVSLSSELCSCNSARSQGWRSLSLGDERQLKLASIHRLLKLLLELRHRLNGVELNRHFDAQLSPILPHRPRNG